MNPLLFYATPLISFHVHVQFTPSIAPLALLLFLHTTSGKAIILDDKELKGKSGEDDFLEILDSEEERKEYQQGLESEEDAALEEHSQEGDFEDPKLALLAKSSVHLSICTEDMWPREVDDKGRMKLLRSELGKLGNKSLLLSLKKITSSDIPQELVNLTTFMNYGSSQVRLDISVPAHFLVAEFFHLTGAKGLREQEESLHVQWLLDEQRYHQKLDLEERTTEGQPFQSSLITKILQAYFVNKNSKLDHFLIQRMKDEKAVPVRLIIIIATLPGDIRDFGKHFEFLQASSKCFQILWSTSKISGLLGGVSRVFGAEIEHCLNEWKEGFRTELFLTRRNMEKIYRLLCLNMRDAEIKVESYPQALSEMFYKDMMAIDYRGKNYQEPKYDYNLLASWVEAQLNKRKNGRQLQEDQGEGSSKGKGSRAEGSRAPGGSRGGAGGGSGVEGTKERKQMTGNMDGRQLRSC
ncbi:hypothetical protein C8R42DRAFT_715369 [Lentinula raphanica]|nr:hypothetical protein C8R42DRAFT_715369 [Lentinula raphanica]